VLALQIKVNGSHRYVVGYASAQMLTLHVWGDCTARDAHATAGASVPTGNGGEMVTLAYEPVRLSIGDEITVRLVEVSEADSPTRENTGGESFRLGEPSSRR
jgi:hypothetical protein